jgi:hypothetical protein
MTIETPDYPPFGAMNTREPTEVTDEIVHHSAGSLTETPLDIDAQHRAQGWAGIGYHLIIDPDGVVYQGRALTDVPAAAQDDNTHSVDICLIGNFQSDDAGYTGPPTDAQIKALEEASVYVHQQCPNIVRTIGHRDVASLFDDPSVATACPGNKLYADLPFVKSAVWNALHPSKGHF